MKQQNTFNETPIHHRAPCVHVRSHTHTHLGHFRLAKPTGMYLESGRKPDNTEGHGESMNRNLTITYSIVT